MTWHGRERLYIDGYIAIVVSRLWHLRGHHWAWQRKNRYIAIVVPHYGTLPLWAAWQGKAEYARHGMIRQVRHRCHLIDTLMYNSMSLVFVCHHGWKWHGMVWQIRCNTSFDKSLRYVAIRGRHGMAGRQPQISINSCTVTSYRDTMVVLRHSSWVAWQGRAEKGQIPIDTTSFVNAMVHFPSWMTRQGAERLHGYQLIH